MWPHGLPLALHGLILFGLSVQQVLDNDGWAHSPRNLECVEIFAGVGAVAAAAKELGLRAATYDKYRIPGNTEVTEDITTWEGFQTAIGLVMRLVPAGLLMLAPVCASWGFMNSSRCQRSACNGYEGNMSYPPVVQGNAIAKASVFLILLAAARGVRAAMENPVSSSMFKYRMVVEMQMSLGMTTAIAYRCAYSSFPYGKRYKKGFRFIATGKWIRGVAAQCHCPGGVHLPLVTKSRGRDGKIRFTGIKKRMIESGTYPLQLGRKIIQCATPGQPLQQSESFASVQRPALRSAKQGGRKAAGAGSVRKTTVKKCIHKVKSAVQPLNQTRCMQCPVSSARAPPSWLQPHATVTIQPGWCAPSATSTRTPRQLDIAQPSWLTPCTERMSHML